MREYQKPIDALFDEEIIDKVFDVYDKLVEDSK